MSRLTDTIPRLRRLPRGTALFLLAGGNLDATRHRRCTRSRRRARRSPATLATNAALSAHGDDELSIKEIAQLARDGNGVCIPGVWIEAAMPIEGPVLRLTLGDEFAHKPLTERHPRQR